ncbi:hypothetical protein KPL71_003573 [Citrus sinensis]|uniref:Uncharacterized protein n=1 Tax=Citrus sinensis TaxID=2711 RepID=A0ACB8MZT3_CITSI|nr:hypothetical protein KPL71_003573 [Citrus sinensis]
MVEEEGEEFDLSTRFIVENEKEKEVKDVGGKISALIKSDKLLGYMAFGHLEAGKDDSITQQVTYNHKAASQADILPSGHHINQNGRILISYYAMGRIEDIWSKDCLEFKPERWISKKVRLVHVPFCKFAAIHGGPRNCLGKDSAFIQMKTIAVAIQISSRNYLLCTK